MVNSFREYGKMVLGIVGGEEMKTYKSSIIYPTFSLIIETKDGDFLYQDQ